ncbi:hypothetical protein ACMFMG_004411 [Clarireedia jacksonii]
MLTWGLEIRTGATIGHNGITKSNRGHSPNVDMSDSDTRPEPTMTSCVAVYHPNWDIDMDSIEHTNYERSWPEDMSNFFPEKTQSSSGVC